MSRMRDHYAVLGLPSGEEGSKLSLEEIKKAFRNQSRIRHPDKRPDDPNATADFQILVSSFEFLQDKAKRSDFDAKLRARREPVLRDSFQDSKRRKMATVLEERERSAAMADDLAEKVRLKENRKRYELKRDIAEFLASKAKKARRAKKASELVRAAHNMSTEIRKPLLLHPLGSIGPGFCSVEDFQNYETFVMKKLQEAAEKKKCMQ